MKLIDFGLSIPNTDRSTSGHIGGTPGYIAPEVLTHHSFNEKADVYSCGIVLYYMLAGFNPFSGIMIKELLSSNKKNVLSFRNCPWISIEARDFILELTSTNPSARPSAAKALENLWLAKTNNSSTLSKTKSIEESGSLCKADSCGFSNALARTASNELIARKVQVLMRSLEEDAKANRVPQLDAQHSILLVELKAAHEDVDCRVPKGSDKVRKHSSGTCLKKGLDNKDIDDVPNERGERKCGMPKLRKKSQFGLKAFVSALA